MNAINAAMSASGSMIGEKGVPESPQTLQLIALAKTGDKSAINLLLDRHRNSLDRLVRMRLDKKILNRVGVSDVVQNVLVDVNRRLSRYLESPTMPFHLWIRHIAKDKIIDAHRRHRVSAKRSVDREQRLLAPKGHQQSSIHLASILGDSQISPAEAMIRKEVCRKVETAISLLNEKDSEIIVMRHYKQLSNQEISRLLNLSDSAASMRYLRAIRRLKELMQNPNLGSA